ncbi:MAG: hypothetical protein A3J48_02635 [Candidatus Doudnabacteria bacterium RIFCSPHIGHO2_02_FULL_46_11]|uniref:N-acetyltransferase domain-containing protein n=1 Tax=Candidatus Doudnabacteria bacterium RIFCSPHIGHO2_02_FULL_46_11 TaxID=1817832 RepID=A0A1F5P886_9BACT|nr:MAG: hypothetical protein A3J48_02635 [Candidatus Doudnabacteria bacterium RIFCSPHIGHO2_02_FULL_46_11]
MSEREKPQELDLNQHSPEVPDRDPLLAVFDEEGEDEYELSRAQKRKYLFNLFVSEAEHRLANMGYGEAQISPLEAQRLTALAQFSVDQQPEQLLDQPLEDINNLISLAIEGTEGSVGAMRTLLVYLRGMENDQERNQQIEKLEEKVSETMTEFGQVTIEGLILLAEINQLRNVLLVSEIVAEKLDESVFNARSLKMLAHLNQSRDINEQILFHKIIDFMESYQETIDNASPDKQQDRAMRLGYRDSSLDQFEDWVWVEQENSANYFLDRHLKNFLDLREGLWNDHKIGAISGVPGGSSDTTIYTFSHLSLSHRLRLGLGINEGFPVINPVLPIAPGYLGYYKDGQLVKIYKYPENCEETARARELVYIKANNPADEYIYYDLNMPVFYTSGGNHPSRGLNRLQDVWDFSDHLKAHARDFYFDLSRIDVSILHPMVLADLITRNQQYIDRKEGKAPTAGALDMKDYQKLLYPSGVELPVEQQYLFRNLVRLPFRKKIEDDFNLDISEMPLYAQVQFLRFLNIAEPEQISRLSSITHGNPDLRYKIAQSFLACVEDLQYGEAILDLVEKLDEEDVNKLLDKYLEIAKTGESIRGFLASRYKGEVDIDLIERAQRNIILRANQILRQARQTATSKQDFTRLLSRVEQEEANASLLASTIRSIVEEGGGLETVEGLSSAEIIAPEISAEDATDMEKIYAHNWTSKTTPEYWQLLRQKFLDSLQNPKARFRILRENGKIIAFLRFTEMEDEQAQPYIHFGAFNVDIPYQSGKIGEAFLTPAIEAEKAQGLPIRCETNPNNTMLKKYKALGFQEIGRVEELGEPEVKLEIPSVARPQSRLAA